MPLLLDPDPKNDAALPLRGGRYRLLEVLGEGGMAVVYRGVDTRLEVERAVKLLLPQMAARPRIRARFDAEARTMARLTHPHIVAIQDVDAEDERVFLVMELLRGGNLWGWVERHGPMPPRLAVEATLPVLDALAFAHQAGVVHRDVKPQNVLLTSEGLPKLTDFGIARIESEDSRTRTAAVMGTWTYMPPEQRKSAKDTDLRADLYAVGAMLWALVRAEDPPDLFAADLDASLLDGLPPPLAAVVRTATRYQREERFPDALAMGQALLDCRGELAPVPPELAALGPFATPGRVSLSQGLSVNSGASTRPPVPTVPPGPPSQSAGPSRQPVPSPQPREGVAQAGLAQAGLAGIPSSPRTAPPPPAFLPTTAPANAAASFGTMVPSAEGTLALEPVEVQAAVSPPPPVGRRGRGGGPLLAALGLVLVVGLGATGAWWLGGRGGDSPPAATAGEDAVGLVEPAAPGAGDPPDAAAAPLALAVAPGSAEPARPATAGASTAGESTAGSATAAASPAASAPASSAPASSAPASSAPASSASEAPASVVPGSEAPAADAPTAAEPASDAPTPSEPASEAPTTSPPASEAPSTTGASQGSTSSGPPGRVTVTGQVTGATLIHQTSGKRYSQGEVPAGDYWLEVRFFGTEQAVRATTVRVISGFSLTVRCQSRTRTCH